jgi:pimeloyl-ACP methyl ester carboxylesterase
MYRSIDQPRLVPAVTIALLVATFLTTLPRRTAADGPADNNPATVRLIPPPGIEVDPTKASELAQRCSAIRKRWDELAQSASASQKPQDFARIDALAAEVLVFPRSVEMALELNQFYRPVELQFAERLLGEAERRIEVIRGGGRWRDVVLTTGPMNPLPDRKPIQRGETFSVIGGYRSEIDGSYQPYGLVVPAGMSSSDTRPRRLDLWFHGRGEKLSEVAFLGGQWTSDGEYSPGNTFVLHPYGRYSNAFRFAGEVDVHEVLAYIRKNLPIDEHKISVRGFSMGGAACWQFATRYPDQWFAANPGAGFSETAGFLDFFQGEPVKDSAPWYQQKMWNLYDGPPYAINLAHCPTVVYSGELDRQKQAADMMEVALAQHDIQMTHIIGPKTEHKIHPESKLEIETRLANLASSRIDQVPTSLEFTTYTLSHHRIHWIDIQGLGEHWTEANLRALVSGPLAIKIDTKNITRLRVDFAAGQWPGRPRGKVSIDIDGTTIAATDNNAPMIASDRSLRFELMRVDGKWQLLSDTNDQSTDLRKRPGLQGPIDDAFNGSFVFVMPSGKSSDPVVQAWYEQESKHAMEQWRKHFRGDVRVVRDDEVSDTWIESANLTLFGDARTNRVIAKLSSALPLDWNETEITIGAQTRPSPGRVVAMIYPNPLNPDHYIVLNSGFTFRQYDFLNNARQTPKLPDWAIIDVTNGATSRDPGKIDAAGFFNESWKP